MNQLALALTERTPRSAARWLAALLVCALCAAMLARILVVHPAAEKRLPIATPTEPVATAKHKAGGVSPYRASARAAQADRFYAAQWGVTHLRVHETGSGNLIRFSYHIVDAALAEPLGDDRATPALIGERSHAMLQVPVMDKIGQLRQHGKQAAGKDYWMVFSNKGNLIKPGERVDVVIGNFHAEGLVLE